MSVEKNIDLVKKMIAAYESRDIEKFIEFFDEDALDYTPAREEPLKGRDEIRKDNEEFISSIPNVQFEILNAFGQANWVCVEGIVSGTYKGQNRKFKVHVCNVVKIGGNKVSEVHEYFDQLAFQT
ncbi:MAG: nuclear transport factor 2 family protein [Candidatus Heimdallarchaeota archaeon]